MHNREIPVPDVEATWAIQQLPLRYRREALAGQLAFDWTLPPDDSLRVYRANLRAIRGNQQAATHRRNAEARHLTRFGHTMQRMPSGKCRECNRLRVAKRYRLERGIPLERPLLTRAEAGRLGGLRRRAS